MRSHAEQTTTPDQQAWRKGAGMSSHAEQTTKADQQQGEKVAA
jgi:hypothetical protein